MTKLERATLEALKGIGGATVLDAVWTNLIRAGFYDIGPRDISKALRSLQRKRLVFSQDGHGSLSTWGGINRGRYWSTRETLERDFGYTDEEFGGPPLEESVVPEHLRWLVEAPLFPGPRAPLVGKGSAATSKGTGSGSSKGTGGTPPIEPEDTEDPPEDDEGTPDAKEPEATKDEPEPDGPKGLNKSANPKGPSVQPYIKLSPRAISLITMIARSARDNKVVRIYYTPKVTTGKTVSRTIEPYSVRFRNIHVDGYDRPPRRTVVVFGHDVTKGHIKMFVADRIKSVKATGRTFRPRWDVEFESVQMDAAEREHVLHEHSSSERERPLVWHTGTGRVNVNHAFNDRKRDEGTTHVQRDRSPKDRRPDPTKSAAQRANHRKNAPKQKRGQEKWTKSAQGKAFYRKLARFNAERGAETEDLGFTRDEVLGGAFDDDPDTKNLLTKVFSE